MKSRSNRAHALSEPAVVEGRRRDPAKGSSEARQ